MKPGEIVVLLLAAAFGLLILRNIVRYVRAEYAKHREPVIVDGSVRLFRPDNLLTDAERRFAATLEPALPDGTRLLAKCRMIELVQPVLPDHHRFHEAAKRLILAKDVDFVVADRNWQVLFAIELDDRSHDRDERRHRDRLVEAVFREAGVPLLRVRTNEDWSTPALERRIAAVLAERLRSQAPLNSTRSAVSSRRRPAGTAPE